MPSSIFIIFFLNIQFYKLSLINLLLFYKKLLCFIGSTISISHRAPLNFEIMSIDVLFEPFLVLFSRYFFFNFCLLFFLLLPAWLLLLSEACHILLRTPRTQSSICHLTRLQISILPLWLLYRAFLKRLLCRWFLNAFAVIYIFVLIFCSFVLVFAFAFLPILFWFLCWHLFCCYLLLCFCLIFFYCLPKIHISMK